MLLRHECQSDVAEMRRQVEMQNLAPSLEIYAALLLRRNGKSSCIFSQGACGCRASVKIAPARSQSLQSDEAGSPPPYEQPMVRILSVAVLRELSEIVGSVI